MTALVLTDLTRLLIDWFAQAKVIRFAHEMKNGETGEVAAGAVLVAVHIE